MVTYGINALVSLVLGSFYLFRVTFMPYHREALGTEWTQLDANLQVLLEALMDVAGAGWIALGIATAFLILIPMRRGEVWSRYLIPVLFLLFYGPTLYATLKVMWATGASTPWYGNALGCLAAIFGLTVDQPWSDHSPISCTR